MRSSLSRITSSLGLVTDHSHRLHHFQEKACCYLHFAHGSPSLSLSPYSPFLGLSIDNMIVQLDFGQDPPGDGKSPLTSSFWKLLVGLALMMAERLLHAVLRLCCIAQQLSGLSSQLPCPVTLA